MQNQLTRRRFLGASLGSALTASAISQQAARAASPASAKNKPALENLRVGFIGLGSQGKYLLSRFAANKQVQIAALCDCNAQRIDSAQKELPTNVDHVRDFRKLLDRKDLDAVVIATPDHWHCLNAIHACQAGKDVYVEKPLSLCIDEGRELVKHARALGRIVQVGLMQRSGPIYQEVVERIRNGELGKVSVVKAWNIYNRLPVSEAKQKTTTPPSDLDWSMWLGPRPERPYAEHLTRGGFRWVWDFGGGNLTDRGTHSIDTILQAMNAKFPKRISAAGGKYVVQDPADVRETPDTLNVLYDFGDWTLHYEAREANHRVQWPSGYGTTFFGSRASLFLDRGGYRIYRERNREGLTGEELTRGSPGEGKVVKIDAMFDPHIQNFIDCIGTRKSPVCDVEIGHRSTSVSHLGNIAYHTKRTIEWDGLNETCGDDEDAQRWLSREYRAPWTLPKVG
jgi:predicted dehydrogenase